MRNSDSLHREVSSAVFRQALGGARKDSFRIANATSPEVIVASRPGQFYLSIDGRSGFAVTDAGELCGVFSTVKGRGDTLVRDAVFFGATHLDCFDGYLPTLYARNGFRETHRAANWTAGQPDVVYMRLCE